MAGPASGWREPELWHQKNRDKVGCRTRLHAGAFNTDIMHTKHFINADH